MVGLAGLCCLTLAFSQIGELVYCGVVEIGGHLSGIFFESVLDIMTHIISGQRKYYRVMGSVTCPTSPFPCA